MSMSEEFYFTITATSDEHDIIEWDIRKYCDRHNIAVKYYRQFKNEHVPTQREGKIVGNQIDLNRFKVWCTRQECPIRLENFWKSQEGEDHLNDVKNNHLRGWSRIERLRSK